MLFCVVVYVDLNLISAQASVVVVIFLYRASKSKWYCILQVRNSKTGVISPASIIGGLKTLLSERIFKTLATTSSTVGVLKHYYLGF